MATEVTIDNLHHSVGLASFSSRHFGSTSLSTKIEMGETIFITDGTCEEPHRVGWIDASFGARIAQMEESKT
jgi:hypothetical protein